LDAALSNDGGCNNKLGTLRYAVWGTDSNAEVRLGKIKNRGQGGHTRGSKKVARTGGNRV